MLVVSFLALATLWPRPRLQSVTERAVLRLPRVLDPLCGTLGVATFAFLVYAGFAGAQSAQMNVLPTVVYVLFWVGVPFASGLLGDVFRAFNPWRALERLAGRAAAREGTLPRVKLGRHLRFIRSQVEEAIFGAASDGP